MLEVRIKNLGPQLHAIGGDGMNLSALWQRSTPSAPERSGPDHFFAIEIDPSGPLRDDSGMPSTSSFLIRKDMACRRGSPKHVQVMHLAEQILQILKIAAPRQMQFGQKIFDSVAKTLYS